MEKLVFTDKREQAGNYRVRQRGAGKDEVHRSERDPGHREVRRFQDGFISRVPGHGQHADLLQTPAGRG